MSIFKISKEQSLIFAFCFMFALVSPYALEFLAISGGDALAAGAFDDNAFVTAFCNILAIVTGQAGRAFAAFAVLSVGIGFFTGKVSWGLLIGVTAGIAALFGAPTIVDAIAGGDDSSCTTGDI